VWAYVILAIYSLNMQVYIIFQCYWFCDKYIVTWRLIAGIVEQEEVVIAGQWHGKHVSVATTQHVTIRELLEVVFSMQSVLRLYSEDQWEKLIGQSQRLPVKSP
jgi:hypothetical protein